MKYGVIKMIDERIRKIDDGPIPSTRDKDMHELYKLAVICANVEESEIQRDDYVELAARAVRLLYHHLETGQGKYTDESV